MKQKDAVYQAVVNVYGKSDSAYAPTKEQRTEINQILFEGFRAGKIDLDKEFDDAGLKVYVSGLQSNWLRKHEGLNGGVKYTAKNPGSRSGSTDPQVKAMRILLSTKTDTQERQEIQAFIDRRLSEIKPTKQTTLTPEQVEVLRNAGLEHMIDA